MNQNAPNKLEYIREFLNTWRIPNDTREAIDLLQTEEDIKKFMKESFHEELLFHTIEELKVFEKIFGRQLKVKDHCKMVREIPISCTYKGRYERYYI